MARPRFRLLAALILLAWVGGAPLRAQPVPPSPGKTPAQTFAVTGVVHRLLPGELKAIIRHDEIPAYMDAMTMPFKVKAARDLDGLQPGDEVRFRLHVTGDESWMDTVTKTGRRRPAPAEAVTTATNATSANAASPTAARHPLFASSFTNELGQAVTLGDFKGRALALTFIFTRCPIPDYCPRLSKNFEEASRQLAAMKDAPTNWHFLSVTIEPEFDTPPVLKGYAKRFQYDPARWSFLTGPTNEIAQLARQSGLTSEGRPGALTHNFRTLIINPAGQLQTAFPTSGNLSDAIVAELLKAATNVTAPPRR